MSNNSTARQAKVAVVATSRNCDLRRRHGHTQDSRLVYHYTTGYAFWNIIRDGEIKPSEPLVGFPNRGIAWFSTNPYWEKAAGKSLITHDGEHIPLTKSEISGLFGGLFRFGVSLDTAPLTWPDIRKTSGIPAPVTHFVYVSGIEMGAKPGEWRGTYDPVPAEKWKTIEVFEKSVWIPLERSTTILTVNDTRVTAVRSNLNNSNPRIHNLCHNKNKSR